MALLDDNPELDLYDREWLIHTRSEGARPAKIGPTAQVHRSLISHGCVINGTVVNSVLSPGVRVDVGAVVRDSIVMFDTVIRTGAVVDRAILDKEVVVGQGAIVGDGPDFDTPNKHEPGRLNTGITVVGKQSVVPRGTRLGRNVKVGERVRATDFSTRAVKSGGTVEPVRPPQLAGPGRRQRRAAGPPAASHARRRRVPRGRGRHGAGPAAGRSGRLPAMSTAPRASACAPADVEAWLAELGSPSSSAPTARASRRGTSSSTVAAGPRLRITLILDPALALICWAHYAPPINDRFRRSYRRLLRWNDELPFVKFSVGEDERPLLVAEIPIAAVGGRARAGHRPPGRRRGPLPRRDRSSGSRRAAGRRRRPRRPRRSGPWLVARYAAELGRAARAGAARVTAPPPAGRGGAGHRRPDRVLLAPPAEPRARRPSRAPPPRTWRWSRTPWPRRAARAGARPRLDGRHGHQPPARDAHHEVLVRPRVPGGAGRCRRPEGLGRQGRA